MKKTILAFIILNYNDSASTIALADSLCRWKQNDFHIHVIVVDNRSKDGSYPLLIERYSGISAIDVIESGKNGGYSYGNNFGVQYAAAHYSPDYIAIANPDIEIEESTVEDCLKTFSEDSSVGGVSPVMCDLNGNYTICQSRLPEYYDDLMQCFNDCFCRTVIRENFTCLHNKSNMILTETLPGSFFIASSKCFEQIGMFDENVFLFCEERIIGHKMKSHGYKMVLRPDLFFRHVHGASIRKSIDIIQVQRHLMRSRLYYNKHYNRCGFFKIVLLWICMVLSLLLLKTKLFLHNMKQSLKQV